MPRVSWLWVLVTAFLLVGCASTSSTVNVNTDGSWTRTLKLTVRDAPSLGDDAQQKKPDVFAIPTSADWTKSQTDKDGEHVTTLTRKFSAGDEPATDIVIKDKSGTKYKNFVVVRKLDGNRIEYYEKIVMVGEKKGHSENEKQEFVKDLKSAIPAGKVTDQELDDVAGRTEIAITRMLFGPDDHLFGMMLTNIDGAVRRIRNRMVTIETKIFADVLSAKLTEEERNEAVHKLLEKFDSDSMKDSQKANPPENPSDDNSSFVGMTAVVKLPGKVLETNGEIDNFSGEVYWDLMSNSADPGVVELRAVCQLP